MVLFRLHGIPIFRRRSTLVSQSAVAFGTETARIRRRFPFGGPAKVGLNELYTGLVGTQPSGGRAGNCGLWGICVELGSLSQLV